MTDWIQILLLTLIAGLTMPLGAFAAAFERIHPSWLESEVRHTIIAFGGGALLAAVALVLVPNGTAHVSTLTTVLCFASGGIAFMLLDRKLVKNATPASQLVAMLSDFIPEALALGATFAIYHNSALLLAGIIALQNLPEGFNAYRELMTSGHFRPMHIVGAFSLMALLGPLAGFAGYFFLTAHLHIVSGIMLFSAGGILYIVFQDIAPQAKLVNHWAPPLGAVGGFLLGISGQLITGG